MRVKNSLISLVSLMVGLSALSEENAVAAILESGGFEVCGAVARGDCQTLEWETQLVFDDNSDGIWGEGDQSWDDWIMPLNAFSTNFSETVSSSTLSFSTSRSTDEDVRLSRALNGINLQDSSDTGEVVFRFFHIGRTDITLINWASGSTEYYGGPFIEFVNRSATLTFDTSTSGWNQQSTASVPETTSYFALLVIAGTGLLVRQKTRP